MKAPITSFNGWILSKITNFLSAKEGCEIETSNYTPDGIRAVFKDAFGYRYEISLKTLSRVQTDPANDSCWEGRPKVSAAITKVSFTDDR